MEKGSKIILTIILVIVFFVIFGAIVGTREAAGHSTPGVLGIVLMAALIGALKAIWKKSDDDTNKKV